MRYLGRDLQKFGARDLRRWMNAVSRFVPKDLNSTLDLPDLSCTRATLPPSEPRKGQGSILQTRRADPVTGKRSSAQVQEAKTIVAARGSLA